MDCTHLVRIFETDVEQFRVVLTKMMTRGPLSNMKDDEMLPPIKQERWWDVVPYQTWKIMRCCPLSNMKDDMLPPIKHERRWDVAPYQTWKKMRCCPLSNMKDDETLPPGPAFSRLDRLLSIGSRAERGLLTYANCTFNWSCLCSVGAGTTVFFKREIKVNCAVLTSLFIGIHSGIVTVVIVYRCAV